MKAKKTGKKVTIKKGQTMAHESMMTDAMKKTKMAQSKGC